MFGFVYDFEGTELNDKEDEGLWEMKQCERKCREGEVGKASFVYKCEGNEWEGIDSTRIRVKWRF